MKSFWNFLKKNKLYTVINLVGLTLSLAFVLLLASYVWKQLSTDSFQVNADRIFVIANEENVNSGYWLDKHLKREFPEIEKGCSVARLSASGELSVEGETVYGTVLAADSTFFDIFSYELLSGNKADWALSWDRCMVSREFANAHFQEKDPVGRTIVLNQGSGSYALTVCGVLKAFGNSVLKTPDVLVRGELMRMTNSSNDEFMSNAGSSICFVMQYAGAALKERQQDILTWCKEHYWVYKMYHSQVRIIPLRDLYFLGNGAEDYNGTVSFGNRSIVNLLLAMCLLLLLFAVLNYINMTTALAGFRAKEMATRRLLGAEKRSIFYKIIAESTLMCGISMLFALLLAELLSPEASRLLNYGFSIFSSVSTTSLLIILGFVLLLGVAAGIVPALLIQKAEPIEIVRGALRLKTKTVYSKIIIVLQNAVTCIMLVCVIAMYLQIRNMIGAPLGYNTKDIIVLDNNYGRTGEIRPLLDKLSAETLVEMVGQGNGIPLSGTNNWTVELADGNWVSFQQIIGDSVYFNILGLKEKQDNHNPNNWWFNEYAFKQIGIDESSLEIHTAEAGTFEVGGVYSDFKIFPLEERQSAAIIFNRGVNPDNIYPWNLLIKTSSDHKASMDRVRAVVAELYPGKQFQASYIEDMIDEGFAAERQVLEIVLVFTLLSILVSALGLYAMCSYYMQQEIRSVSVKKVFGAEHRKVFADLVLSFMKLVGIAFVLGTPLAWYVMHLWLGRFGHRISLEWWIFAIAGILTALMAGISVLYQSSRTAGTNPADVLKKD